MGTCHDLRVVRRLERELHQRQKMDALGQLAGGVAHDFNNLLLVVTQNAALLEAELDGEHRELAEEIGEAGHRASDVSQQLLQFSRQDAVEARDVAVAPLLERFAGMLRRIVGVAHPIDVQLPSEPIVVRVDPGQLEQVLLNLVINARDALPDGGTITVAVARRETSDGPRVRFQVSDRGEGIDPEVLPNIFDPFFTTKERGTGTGLGLSTAWGIVRSAGGSIHVDSELGRGTTFSVYLPPSEVSRAAPGRTSSTGGFQAAPIEDVLVTLVDDDRMVRNAVRRWLARAGYQVRGFASGQEALAAFDGDSGDLGPQILVTDVVMPHLSGPELARKLAERHPEIPVILISGQPADQLPAELGRHTRFLAKPFEPKHLSQLILELVNAALSDRAEEP